MWRSVPALLMQTVAPASCDRHVCCCAAQRAFNGATTGRRTWSCRHLAEPAAQEIALLRVALVTSALRTARGFPILHFTSFWLQSPAALLLPQQL